jgi:hypothetical protein
MKAHQLPVERGIFHTSRLDLSSKKKKPKKVLDLSKNSIFFLKTKKLKIFFASFTRFKSFLFLKNKNARALKGVLFPKLFYLHVMQLL